MTDNISHPQLKYLIYYTLAMVAAFSTFKTFYMFEAEASFGFQMVAINFGLILLLWLFSFVHSNLVKNNIFLIVILPFVGLQSTNMLFLVSSSGTSLLGYLAFIASSSTLLFISYRAREYEKHI